ncbi:hypothetical protein FPHOBKDP_00031 [Listeria phage LPJP1]|nr:hypothetical protein FPHOBKDP_00031 [Listeria phage LPJP1]
MKEIRTFQLNIINKPLKKNTTTYYNIISTEGTNIDNDYELAVKFRKSLNNKDLNTLRENRQKTINFLYDTYLCINSKAKEYFNGFTINRSEKLISKFIDAKNAVSEIMDIKLEESNMDEYNLYKNRYDNYTKDIDELRENISQKNVILEELNKQCSFWLRNVITLTHEIKDVLENNCFILEEFNINKMNIDNTLWKDEKNIFDKITIEAGMTNEMSSIINMVISPKPIDNMEDTIINSMNNPKAYIDVFINKYIESDNLNINKINNTLKNSNLMIQQKNINVDMIINV